MHATLPASSRFCHAPSAPSRLAPARRGGLGAARVAALLAGLLGGLVGGGRPAGADDQVCRGWIRQAAQSLAESERLTEAGDTVKARNLADQVLGLLERAHDHCPGSLEVSGQGVVAAVFAADLPRARTWLERYGAANAYGERDPQIHYLRALIDLRLAGRPDTALRALERMQGLAPALHAAQRETLYYEALLLWGAQLADRELYEEAGRQFQTAALVARRMERPSKERRARANAAIVLLRSRRYEDAGRVFEQLRQEEPANPLWTYQLGQAYAYQFRYQEAVEAYRLCLAAQAGWRDTPALEAELGKARLRLGNCLRVLAGRESDAARREALLTEGEAVLRAYLAAAPRDPLGPKWLGVLLFEERDDPLAALPLFEASFQLDPWCENTLRYLIRCHDRAPGPPTPGGREPTPEELAAWTAKRKAWEADLVERAQARKDTIRERAALTADLEGGCM